MDDLTNVYSRARLDVPELTERGLLLEVNGGGAYRLLSPSLGRWIAREISAIPGEEESPASVGEWLKSGSTEELDALSGALPKFKKKYWPIVSSVMMDLSLELLGAVTWEILSKGAF